MCSFSQYAGNLAEFRHFFGEKMRVRHFNLTTGPVAVELFTYDGTFWGALALVK